MAPPRKRSISHPASGTTRLASLVSLVHLECRVHSLRVYVLKSIKPKTLGSLQGNRMAGTGVPHSSEGQLGSTLGLECFHNVSTVVIPFSDTFQTRHIKTASPLQPSSLGPVPSSESHAVAARMTSCTWRTAFQAPPGTTTSSALILPTTLGQRHLLQMHLQLPTPCARGLRWILTCRS